MIYKQIFPTKWPLLDFSFEVWKLAIRVELMRASMESLAYEYLRLGVFWKGKLVWHIRLYDTERRVRERIDGILMETKPMTKRRLLEYRRIINEELKKLPLPPEPKETKK